MTNEDIELLRALAEDREPSEGETAQIAALLAEAGYSARAAATSSSRSGTSLGS